MKKNFILVLGFQSKENASDIFIKNYQDEYVIEIDFHKNFFSSQ